nr:hypothetical protein [Burkholderia cepacia]
MAGGVNLYQYANNNPISWIGSTWVVWVWSKRT